MPKSVTIGGKTYERVPRIRVDSEPVAVYKAGGQYLRLGERDIIRRYLDAHTQMEQANYPVAKLLGTGEHGRWRYYVERSLGEKTYANLFSLEYDASGAVSDATFGRFIDTAARYLAAQLKAPRQNSDFPSFVELAHVETLMAELSAKSETIADRLHHATQKLQAVPFVLTHGDFNPANMFPGGVIDIENAMVAPLGYDAVTAIETPDWFIKTEESKGFFHYVLSGFQKAAYRAMCEDLYRNTMDMGMIWNDLTFFRAAWMTVRMQKWPQVQAFRYAKFIDTYLA